MSNKIYLDLHSPRVFELGMFELEIVSGATSTILHFDNALDMRKFFEDFNTIGARWVDKEDS